VTVLLNNSEYDYHLVSNSFVRHQSLISKKRSYSDYGDHWYFGITLNLYKYADLTKTDLENYAIMKAKYLEIKSHLNNLVYLYPHSDGSPFIDNEDNQILWKLFLVQPVWIFSPKFPDRLKIQFETTHTGYIQPALYVVDDKGWILTDDLDREIISRKGK
jgi:hypothetical protein